MTENQEIILHEGNLLERVVASSIIQRKDKPLMQNKRLFLASDVIVGEYGVTGFLVVDNKPEDRWWSYTDGEKTGCVWSETDSLQLTAWKKTDPNRLSHYLNTSTGFKMIRYFVLPSNVKEFFDKDRYLGDPMINKCACEGTIPEYFDEERVNPSLAFSGGQRELVDEILEYINPRLEKIGESRFSWEDFGHNVYFSFHPWQAYKPVLQAGEESIIKAIGNFDQFLSIFDQKKALRKRILELG